MRTYAEETNRLNRERSNGETWQAELAKVEKDIRGIIEAIRVGMLHESMKAKMDALETRRIELTTLLADTPDDKPDLLPTAAAIYAKKLDKPTKALNHAAEAKSTSCAR